MFHEIFGKLKAFNSSICNKELTFKLLQTLPDIFFSLTVMLQASDTRLENLVNTIESKLAHQLGRK